MLPYNERNVFLSYCLDDIQNKGTPILFLHANHLDMYIRLKKIKKNYRVSKEKYREKYMDQYTIITWAIS